MGKEVIEHQRKINWEGTVEVSVELFYGERESKKKQ